MYACMYVLGIFAVASYACESGLWRIFCFYCIELNTVIISLLPVVKVYMMQGNTISPLPIYSQKHSLSQIVTVLGKRLKTTDRGTNPEGTAPPTLSDHCCML